MSKLFSFKEIVIRLIRKTNNPVSPIAFKNLSTGIEQVAKVMVPLSNQTFVDKLSKRLLQDFSDDELQLIGNKPDFILAILSITKVSTIGFCQKEKNEY